MIAAAAAAALALQPFRYERTLAATGARAALVVADAAMLAHARADLSDLRVVDANGGQVAWRRQPASGQSLVRVPLVDRGRRGALAVARLRNPGVVDRIVLDVPDRRFHGTVAVYGSDDRRAWTRLSTTEIYAVGGARTARSTTALVPRTDYRWLELRATGVSRIDGASVAARAVAPLLGLPADFAGGVLDLHYRVPVARLVLTAATRRYSRPFRVETLSGVVVASGALVRDGPPHTTVVPLDVRARRLRIVIANGDDPPLRKVRVTAFAPRVALVVEGGHTAPLRLYYGAAVGAPQYDFARLPFHGSTAPASLGPEHPNPAFRLVDRRSFFARHGTLVTAALAVAAAAVLAAGALALRRP